MSLPYDLEGRVALVTGASGGLGAAMAEHLHARGATVVLSGTRKEKLEAQAADLGERVHVCAADLSRSDEADKLANDARTAAGGLDFIIANAGVTQDGLLMRMKDADWDKVLTVNLESQFRLIRAALKALMKQRFGRIVAITSVVGHTGNPGQANYVASKAGLTGFIKSLAQEVASRGITANCVAPGFIATPMTDALSDEQREGILGMIPQGRMGTPEDVAHAVGFLCGPSGDYVTGQTLHVNGGMAMP
jgi:3-oxoacyl-[acyl-carrier protein] reductase